MATVRLIRRVYFSSGHRYWIPALSEKENRALFGKWASPYNHGHNYVLDVTTQGLVDPSTGMVVNIKDIDEVLQEKIVSQFDGRSINDEIEHFQTRASSLENIILFVKDQLTNLPQQVQLVGLRLEEMPTLWCDLTRGYEGAGWLVPAASGTNQPEPSEIWTMTLTRTYEFAASHRLHIPDLPDSKNYELFGKCNNPAGHGHNYTVEVSVSAEPDPDTGMMIDLLKLDEVVNEEVVERYDHKNLNEDLPEFKGRVSTSEMVVQEIWKRLEGKVPGKLERVRLYETARSFFEIVASPSPRPESFAERGR